MAKITRFFEDVAITAAGLEIEDIIGGVKYLHTGVIDQIVVEDSTASATSIDIEVRYISDNSERHNLVYLFTTGDMPVFVDSDINACFSLKNKSETITTGWPPTVVSRRIDGDLHLHLLPDVAGVFNIRIDFNINNLAGL